MERIGKPVVDILRPLGFDQNWLRNWREFDFLVLLMPLFLLGFGCVAIYSTDPGQADFRGQLTMGILGIGIMAGLSRFPYQWLQSASWLIYALVNASLLAVMFLGREALGAQRWIEVGGVSIQPSEFAKLGIIVVLAAFIRRFPINSFLRVWMALAVVAVPALLIFKQPDLGSSLVFGAVSLAMLYWGGARLSWLIMLTSPLAAAILFALWVPAWMIWCAGMGVLAWWTLSKSSTWQPIGMLITVVINLISGGLGQKLWNVLKPYQQKRLTIFLDPNQDPLGSGYHILQSQIAVGSGQFWGRGLFSGTQTQLNFIPEQHTDFIFSALGEETGFLGCMILLGCFFTLFWRLTLIANDAPDDFGSLVVVGVFAMLLFQTVINVGMNIGVAPVTGIPLPFVSFGRSALLTNFVALGLVQAVAQGSRKRWF